MSYLPASARSGGPSPGPSPAADAPFSVTVTEGLQVSDERASSEDAAKQALSRPPNKGGRDAYRGRAGNMSPTGDRPYWPVCEGGASCCHDTCGGMPSLAARARPAGVQGGDAAQTKAGAVRSSLTEEADNGHRAQDESQQASYGVNTPAQKGDTSTPSPRPASGLLGGEDTAPPASASASMTPTAPPLSLTPALAAHSRSPNKDKDGAGAYGSGAGNMSPVGDDPSWLVCEGGASCCHDTCGRMPSFSARAAGVLAGGDADKADRVKDNHSVSKPVREGDASTPSPSPARGLLGGDSPSAPIKPTASLINVANDAHRAVFPSPPKEEAESARPRSYEVYQLMGEGGRAHGQEGAVSQE